MEQLTLGGFIDRLECVLSEIHKDELGETTIRYDFGTAIPTEFGSRRGDYREVELGYVLTGYDGDNNHHGRVLATELLAKAKETVGATFEGRKGGEFTMYESTRLWISNSGNASHTGVTDVTYEGYEVVIHTANFEY